MQMFPCIFQMIIQYHVGTLQEQCQEYFTSNEKEENTDEWGEEVRL